MPKVSVIMPSLNVRPYIEECMESVLAQTLRDIEILCVDAGSTDGTLELLRGYAGRDARVRVIVSDRKSYGYQMNLGLDAASGEYIGIVETDDYIAPEMYRELYARADREKLDVIKGSFYRFYGEGRQRRFVYAGIASRRLYGRVLDPAQDPSVMDRRSLYSWAGIYRTAFLRENGIRHNETPGASFQDNGFWFQVFTQARRLRFLRKPYYRLRRDNPGSSFHSREKVYCICEEYDFIRDFLHRNPELEERFAPSCALYRYLNYIFSLNRIGEEYKKSFLRRFSEDFNRIENEGELKRELFSDAEWGVLREIMDDPELFYYAQAPRECLFAPETAENTQEQLADLRLRLGAAEKALERAEAEKAAIRSSATYRTGQAVTWLPRRLRNALQRFRG